MLQKKQRQVQKQKQPTQSLLFTVWKVCKLCAQKKAATITTTMVHKLHVFPLAAIQNAKCSNASIVLSVAGFKKKKRLQNYEAPSAIPARPRNNGDPAAFCSRTVSERFFFFSLLLLFHFFHAVVPGSTRFFIRKNQIFEQPAYYFFPIFCMLQECINDVYLHAGFWAFWGGRNNELWNVLLTRNK